MRHVLAAGEGADDERCAIGAVAHAVDVARRIGDERRARGLRESQLRDDWVVRRHAREAHREENEVGLDDFPGTRHGLELRRPPLRRELPFHGFDLDGRNCLTV